MKFQLRTNKEQLYGLIHAVSGVIRRSTTIPIIGNVLIKSNANGSITAIGTDLEIEIISTRKIGQFSGSLDTTVECKKLVEFLQTLDADDDVEIEASDNDRVTLKGAGANLRLACLPAVDYPRVVIPDAFEQALRISQRALKGIIERTGFAMAVIDVRYYLVGMLLAVENGKLNACSTNGHRLAFDEATVEADFSDRVEVILPRRSVLELRRLMHSIGDLVEIQMVKNQARFRFGEVEFVTKLIEGRFPDVQRVIPMHNDIHVKVNRAQLILAVQRASIIMDEKNVGLRLVIDRDLVSGALRIESANSNNESVNLAVRLDDYNGPRVETGLNASYLLDALSTMDDESIVMSFGDTLNPGPLMITLLGRASFKYVVMPLRM